MNTTYKRTVLLTGAAGTLGSCFIDTYAQQFQIIGVARHAPECLSDLYAFVEGDVCADAAQIIGQVLEHFGPVDILINNAVCYNWKKLEDTTPEEMQDQLNTNFIAPVDWSNRLLQQCWKKHAREENLSVNRSIVNISSIAAVHDYFGYGQGLYAAAKAALNTVTRHMASEYDINGIRVNAVAPNTFPHYVGTKTVCDTIYQLITGDENGKIIILDREP